MMSLMEARSIPVFAGVQLDPLSVDLYTPCVSVPAYTMLFASKTTFIRMPGGPAVFSHGDIGPETECCLAALATIGAFGTTTPRLARMAAAIPSKAQRLWRYFPDLLALASTARPRFFIACAPGVSKGFV